MNCYSIFTIGYLHKEIKYILVAEHGKKTGNFFLIVFLYHILIIPFRTVKQMKKGGGQGMISVN